jgi:hypothetical protein
MGAELSQEPGQPRSVRVQVHAPVGVERIEIVRDDPANPVHTETFDVPTWNPPVLEWTDTEPLAGEAFYYARVFMEGQQMAWTSPIWVVAG